MNGLIKGDEEYLHVKLEDNRIISTPIEWESIDYHLNIESMLEVLLKKVA
ncbi:hypothetical protein MNB_SV-15-1000 [hydrothermal vent metagenome]|uniref:Uncharacterized protein n=1 Tax=hydrothermal vent metagenome TaxID=652676 RepID=A0A1W1EIP4_9ZZZZ